MSQRLIAFLSTALACTLILTSFALADELTPRQFSPVQDGFQQDGERVATYAAGRLLVQFTPEGLQRSGLTVAASKGSLAPAAKTGLASIDLLASDAGVLSVERPYDQPRDRAKADALGVDRWFMFRFNTKRDMADLAKEFERLEGVEAVSVDWVAFPAAVPSDPLHADHWGHNNTAQLPDLDWGGTYAHTLPNTVGTVGFDANAQAAWDQGYGTASVVIAILDSGVDVGHPDLRQVAGYDFGDNDTNPDDNSASAGHGTACAGVAASIRNSLGAAGIAADCSIMPCKVANSAGSMYFSSIQNALYWSADNGADIISMSLGAAISSDAATNTALTYAFNAGCVILAATGNENAGTISYPAIHSTVIGVGAASPCGERKRSSSSSAEVNPGVSTDPNGYTCDGERWWGSNYGLNTVDGAGAVDIIAPTILPTTDIQGSGGYDSGDYSGFFNGTSCATPYAAGVCALIKSANPTWTNTQIRDQLVGTAQDVVSVESGSGWDRYTGYGMVDAAAAVGGGGPVPPTAQFVGAPVSGDFPLNVSFTDQSSGAPTSWSWTFGDGGTSLAQNPSHTYTAIGNYTVNLTATNAAGSDVATRTNYIVVTEPGTGSWQTITSDDFEGGLGSYTDGGGDMALYTGGTYAHQGSNAADIQDNTSTASSFYHTNSYDVSGYTDLEVEFWFMAVSMDTNEDFWVQYFDGSVWRTVATFVQPADYANNVFYNKIVSIPAGSYNYPTNAKLRFQCDASGNSDDVYIDEIVFRGYGDGGTAPTPPVAAFTADVTTGTAPLAVQFTDQSTNTPTNWSWTFGDGSTATSQNPGHTYATAGTYDVALTVTNSDGNDTMNKVAYITVTTGGGGGGEWITITTDDFESGLGSYTDGGGDCALYTGGTYAYQGNAAMDIQDNSGTRSSFFHGGGHNVSGYVDLEVEFTFVAVSMETNENFFVEYFDGSSWNIVADFAQGPDFVNNTFYTATVTIPSGSYNYPSNAQLRFRCDASNNTDDVYIDTIVFRGLTPTGAGGDIELAGKNLPTAFNLRQNYPNPFNPSTMIEFSLPRDEHVMVTIFDVKGREVARLIDDDFSAGIHSVQWNAAGHASGAYFYRIQAGDYVSNRRMLLLK